MLPVYFFPGNLSQGQPCFSTIQFKPMARVQNNNASYGIRGMINQLVFRLVNGLTVVSRPPVRKVPLSARQKLVVTRFTLGVQYAKSVLRDPGLKALYESACKKGQSAFNLALSDYCKSPVIHEIDLSHFSSGSGNFIRAIVTDNFKVVSVRMRIEKPDSTLLEEGEATAAGDGLSFHYVVKNSNAKSGGNKLVVTATDVPGHSTTSVKTI